jgi:hypothetical protein
MGKNSRLLSKEFPQFSRQKICMIAYCIVFVDGNSFERSQTALIFFLMNKVWMKEFL